VTPPHDQPGDHRAVLSDDNEARRRVGDAGVEGLEHAADGHKQMATIVLDRVFADELAADEDWRRENRCRRRDHPDRKDERCAQKLR